MRFSQNNPMFGLSYNDARDLSSAQDSVNVESMLDRDDSEMRRVSM